MDQKITPINDLMNSVICPICRKFYHKYTTHNCEVRDNIQDKPKKKKRK